MLLHRCFVACTTFPTADGWKETGALLLLLAIVALPFGWFSGFLYRQTVSLSWQGVVLLVAASFVSPALSEEIIFRVLPLPLSNETGDAQRLLWAALSLVVFVLYHPVRFWVFPKPHYRVFLDGRFLVLATLLGLFCTAAYLRSGSVLPSVLMHWFFVVVWLIFWGGYERLHVKH